MNIRQLELFVSIVKSGSFQGAAVDSFTTQSTVSQHIASLEDELEVQLLERSRGGVWVTEAGRIILAHATQILGEVNAAKRAIKEYKGLNDAVLRIAASTVPAVYLIPVVVKEMCDKFPNLTIETSQRNSRQVEELLLKHEADIGLVGNRFQENGLKYEYLAKEEIRLAVYPGHPWSARTSVKVDELAEVPIVARTAGSGTEKTVLGALTQTGADTTRHKVRVRVESSEAVKAAVIAGVGISFISELAIQKEIERGELITVAVEGLKIEREFFLVCRATTKLSPPSIIFWDTIKKTVSQYQR